jgi:hypothetical protein
MSQPSIIIQLRADGLPGTLARPACVACGYEDGYLARIVKTNGSVGIRWVCEFCEDYKTSTDIKHSFIGDVPLERLPLRVDNTSPWDIECVVCATPAEQRHHWAPSSIFPDWPQGLTVPVCTAHHDEWHARMRDHGLRWPHELQARNSEAA